MDAKEWSDWPPRMPPGRDPATSDRSAKFKALIEKANLDMIEEARAQIEAANGTPIEWHVSTRERADEIRDLLDGAGLGDITVVFTPP